MEKLALLVGATVFGWAATAENIYYCGLDATYPLNLAIAENWTNELGVATASTCTIGRACYSLCDKVDL